MPEKARKLGRVCRAAGLEKLHAALMKALLGPFSRTNTAKRRREEILENHDGNSAKQTSSTHFLIAAQRFVRNVSGARREGISQLRGGNNR